MKDLKYVTQLYVVWRNYNACFQSYLAQTQAENYEYDAKNRFRPTLHEETLLRKHWRIFIFTISNSTNQTNIM